MSKQPSSDEVRLQFANIFGLANELDMDYARIAAALDRSGMRLQHYSKTIPARVLEILSPDQHPNVSNGKRKHR